MHFFHSILWRQWRALQSVLSFHQLALQKTSCWLFLKAAQRLPPLSWRLLSQAIPSYCWNSNLSSSSWIPQRRGYPIIGCFGDVMDGWVLQRQDSHQRDRCFCVGAWRGCAWIRLDHAVTCFQSLVLRWWVEDGNSLSSKIKLPVLSFQKHFSCVL